MDSGKQNSSDFPEVRDQPWFRVGCPHMKSFAEALLTHNISSTHQVVFAGADISSDIWILNVHLAYFSIQIYWLSQLEQEDRASAVCRACSMVAERNSWISAVLCLSGDNFETILLGVPWSYSYSLCPSTWRARLGPEHLLPFPFAVTEDILWLALTVAWRPCQGGQRGWNVSAVTSNCFTSCVGIVHLICIPDLRAL